MFRLSFLVMFVLCPGRSKRDLSGKGVQEALAGSTGSQKYRPRGSFSAFWGGGVNLKTFSVTVFSYFLGFVSPFW